MTTATAPAPTETAKPVTHTFISRGRQERIVRQPEVTVETALGRNQNLQQPIRIEFGPHGVYDATEGKDVMVDSDAHLVSDEVLRERGLPLRGEPRDEVQFLRSHRDFNIRFHEDGNEPDRVAAESEVIQTIARAALGLDERPIVELLEEELARGKRPNIITAAKNTIEEIRREVVAIEERKRQEEAQAPPPSPPPPPAG